jgi:diguanylate cyclase (GGDEF)-like protein
MWLFILLALLAGIAWLWRQNHALRQQLRESGIYDELTGLYLRHYFIALSEREINRAQRSQLKVSALLIDLDHCAKINHQYGHLAGDLALQHIANAAKASVRDFDLVGRFSGEEIILLLPSTDQAGALVVAERLRQHVKQSALSLSDKTQLMLSVSIGLASLEAESDNVEDLLLAADTALQAAKAKGVEQIHIFSSHDEQLLV